MCGRNATGVLCASSDGSRFHDLRYAVNTSFLDAQGWADERYGATPMLAWIDTSGAASVCGRAATQLACHRLPLDEDRDGIGTPIDNCPATWNPAQADANGDGVGNSCTPGSGGCGIGVGLVLVLPLLRLARIARRRCATGSSSASARA